jgi:hypothetical protein
MNQSRDQIPLPRVPHWQLLMTLCAAVLAFGLVLDPKRAWAGLLTAGVSGAQIAIGSLMFTVILVVTGAKWWLPARRYFLAVVGMLPVPLVAVAVAVLGGLGTLYPWAAHGAAEHSHLLHGKTPWLNPPFFMLRTVAVIVIWLLVAGAVSKAVRRLMASPTGTAHTSLARISAFSIVVLALTISVAFWDWTMSLEPEWFSNMWGVYGFAGAMQGGIAAATVMSIYAARRNRDRGIDVAVRHDFGKLLFAFSFFWAYIWFCQFMLIWYANLPEEVTHYEARFAGGWGVLFYLNPVVNFVVPFFVLLSARAKKHESTLLQVGLLVLVGRGLDIYMMVEPSVSADVGAPFYHLAAALAVVSGMILWARRSQEQRGGASATRAGATR